MLGRSSLFLIWLFMCVGGNVALAESPGIYVSPCLPSALDFTALPPSTTSSPHPDGHLLVLEVQNVSAIACVLQGPSIELLPRSDDGPNILGTSYADEPGDALGTKPLAPGEWAHLLVVWVDRIAPEIPCEEYSTLRLNFFSVPQKQTPDDEAIEVRNLWMHSCSPAFVSPYRVGRFHGDFNLSQKWKQYWEPTKIEGFSFPGQILSSGIVEGSPLFRVHTPVARTMIGDNIQLRLNFSRNSDNGCAFRMLRRRESNGATLILLQNCPQSEAWSEQPVGGSREPGITRLELRNRNLIPDHLGRVEYDILGELSQAKTPVFARASASFLVRDPTNPAEASLTTELAACTATQLQFTALPLMQPKSLINVRAYQARNVSTKTCSVAGIPKLRFMDGKIDDVFYLPKACPNCINDGFAPRPNGRIDLQPGDEAHFLVTGTEIDTKEDPWMHCFQPFPTIEVTPVAGDPPVSLPFAAEACAAVDISAWRQGAFDHDPFNAKWSRTHHSDIGPPARPIPSECNKPELLPFGPPHMISSKQQLAFGLSLASSEFTQPDAIPLHVWVNNSGKTPSSVMTCQDLDAFKGWGFDLYDAYGHRVLRKRELKLKEQCGTKAQANFELGLQACTRNFPIDVPAHTCITGDGYDFSTDLSRQYDLPPGEYTVHVLDHPQHLEDLCSPAQTPFHATPGVDLTFDVLQP
jgi:hypothetical protein